jgi:hypothetical protein
LSGTATGIIRGFESEVVSIKKVMSKNARSTIAVRSTRSGILFAERLPRDFAGEGLRSAMILEIKVKQLVASGKYKALLSLKRMLSSFIATMMQLFLLT